MRTNEMGPTGLENPQLPRRFADCDRTSETAGAAQIGLRPAFVSFYPNLTGKGSGSENVRFPGFFRSDSTEPFGTILDRRLGGELEVGVVGQC